ncbi:SulP family sulfate transporter [Afipia sp. P52-10]|jgi:SulP family sulfate permease|uniref:SulP family inorganic anion transporter n=1 Tax=Afipia sp. P52-10 TaxID=1429916 RepID=UPI0003DF22AE|nr:SulP family inorganic anion transporter [Afipia sp. P52-10]ETR77019.1 SulP family sulfate transporter [Afipia sp. P52-10]
MTSLSDASLSARSVSFGALFTPKLVTILREGYGLADLKADAFAGLTVAIVALPLSMAIAIASGAAPVQGLYTAIVAGFLISALGGSRFQIGGPAGAFIVLVAATVQRHGMDGLFLATIISGVLMMIAGLLRLGTYIKFIPFPVTVGFTAGIAVIIAASQIKDLFGLTLSGHEPGEFLPKLRALAGAIDTINPVALAIAVLTVGIIVVFRIYRPTWPGFLIAVAVAAALTWLFGLPVETIGSRFGELPRTLPWPTLPPLSLEKVQAVLPDAFAFALLGAIESLLSAVVADGMTGRRHRSNCELVAQGVANIASGLFGGICATGTIARTATNVRAGARGPVSGMLHALFVLLMLVFAAPLASMIPLAALAGILIVVAWNMAEKHALMSLLRSSWGDAIVLLVTLLLTIFRDLTEGILVGFGLGTLLFLHRMSEAIRIEGGTPLASEDKADTANGQRKPYDVSLATNPDILVYRIAGAFFFGAAATVGAALDGIVGRPKLLVLDFADVPLLDSTAAHAIEAAVAKARHNGVRVVLTGTSHAVRRVLWASGVHPPDVRFKRSVEDVLASSANAH